MLTTFTGHWPVSTRRTSLGAPAWSPTIAWYSEQAMVGLQAGAPGEVRRVLTGQWPVNVVNRAVKGKNRAGL